MAKVQFSTSHPTKLVISPYGSVFAYGPPEELITRAFRHIVLGAMWLHSHGWSHQDIRWPNVAFKDPDFFLIDLENAQRLPDDEAGRKALVLRDVESIKSLALKHSSNAETAALLLKIREAQNMDDFCVMKWV